MDSLKCQTATASRQSRGASHAWLAPSPEATAKLTFNRIDKLLHQHRIRRENADKFARSYAGSASNSLLALRRRPSSPTVMQSSTAT